LLTNGNTKSSSSVAEISGLIAPLKVDALSWWTRNVRWQTLYSGRNCANIHNSLLKKKKPKPNNLLWVLKWTHLT